MDLPVNYEELTWQERRTVREEYVTLQKGVCYYCGSTLNWSPPQEIRDKEINWDLFPPNFLKYPVHLQHDHDTGMTEGAVHSYCNAVMWQYDHK
jgi:hypothetical protein